MRQQQVLEYPCGTIENVEEKASCPRRVTTFSSQVNTRGLAILVESAGMYILHTVRSLKRLATKGLRNGSAFIRMKLMSVEYVAVTARLARPSASSANGANGLHAIQPGDTRPSAAELCSSHHPNPPKIHAIRWLRRNNAKTASLGSGRLGQHVRRAKNFGAEMFSRNPLRAEFHAPC